MAKKVIDMRSRPAFLHDFYGKTPGTQEYEVTYLGKANNKWLAVPATIGSQIKGPCSRID